METVDWVEEVTGVPGPSLCARKGHDKVQVGEVREVNGKPAAMFQCRVCGLKGFHWLKGRGNGR